MRRESISALLRDQVELIHDTYFVRLISDGIPPAQRPIMFQEFCDNLERVIHRRILNRELLAGKAISITACHALVDYTLAYAKEADDGLPDLVAKEDGNLFFEKFGKFVPLEELFLTESQTKAQGSASKQGAAGPTPILCNTGVISRQKSELPKAGKVETGGLDTVHVSIYGDWENADWEYLKRRFDELRTQAEEGSPGNIYEVPDGGLLEFEAAGEMVGTNIYYRWKAWWSGNRLSFLNRKEYSKSTPVILVQFKAIPLMCYGLAKLWRDLVRDLEAIGFRMNHHVVGRADLCVDLAGVKVRDFTSLAARGHEITKMAEYVIRGSGNYDENHQTYYRGNSERVLMRIYDKIDETKTDAVKRELMVERRWGGELPESATRVEFQVGRKVLKEQPIDTVDDLMRRLCLLWEYLTRILYRLADSPVDRKNRNQSRAAMAPIWEQVRRYGNAWIEQPEVQPVSIPREKVEPEAQKLRNQAWGVIKSIAARLGVAIRTAEDFMEFIRREAKLVAAEMPPGIARRTEEFEKKYHVALLPANPAPF